MATAQDYERLARTHMATQVRQAGAVDAVLIRLWQQHIDPADPWGSFARFRSAATPYLVTGNLMSQRTAEAYVTALRELSGLGIELAPLQAADPDVVAQRLTDAVRRSLDNAEARRLAGKSPLVSINGGRSQALGSGKALVLGGGRNRLLRTVNGSGSNLRGWARVSDGSPCAFCAMLVSRGPVYTKDTGRFRAHWRCGCSLRLVTRNDPSGGWARQAREMADLWESVGGDLKEFRRVLDASRAPSPDAPAALAA